MHTISILFNILKRLSVVHQYSETVRQTDGNSELNQFWAFMLCVYHQYQLFVWCLSFW